MIHTLFLRNPRRDPCFVLREGTDLYHRYNNFRFVFCYVNAERLEVQNYVTLQQTDRQRQTDRQSVSQSVSSSWSQAPCGTHDHILRL